MTRAPPVRHRIAMLAIHIKRTTGTLAVWLAHPLDEVIERPTGGGIIRYALAI